QVDALLLAGDVFDTSALDVTRLTQLAGHLARLGRAGIPTVLIRGNHDALLDHERYGPLDASVFLLDQDRPTVEIAGAALHGIGFAARHVDESLLPRYPRAVPGRINIGLMHTSLGGAAGHDPYAPCAETDLLAHGYEYWALGHIHRRAEYRAGRAVAVMPGIPQGRHIREPGRGSATLATVTRDGTELQTVPIAGLAFQTVAIDLSSAGSQGARIAAIESALSGLAEADHSVAARLLLSGAPQLAAEPGLAHELAERAAEAVPGVAIDAIRFAHADPSDAAGIKELVHMMSEEAATPGFRDEAAELLAAWRNALPPEIRDTLDDADLDDLIAEGVTAVAARLATGGAQ
ncbi:MAG: DNA repair exonuclease, partial [Pseudomonadota bacterium]